MSKAQQKITTKMRGAVLYTRVSTGEQDKKGTSPETQRDACRQKALALGLPVVAEYHDGGVSGGFLLARKEFQAALADIREGRASALICPNIGRYSRDVEHQQAVKKAVRAAGGSLVFCDMSFEDTPEGDLNFTIQGGFAEYEKQVIRKRTMGGRKKRAEEGRQPGSSRAPLGYHVPTKADVLRGDFPLEMLGRYVVDEARAPLVREMFSRYASGQATLAGLCRDLNARRVPTPRGAEVWWPSTVQAILVNPAYKGEPAYGRTITHTDEGRLSAGHPVTGRPLTTPRYRMAAPVGHAITLSAPPLVTAAVWEEAQRRMGLNRTHQGGNPQRARMLSGRAFLPCGHSAIYQPASGRSPAYYHCGIRQRRRTVGAAAGDGAGCVADCCRADVAERSVAFAFLEAARDPQALADARRLYDTRQRAAEPEGGPDARRELAALGRALVDLAEEDILAVRAQMAGMRAGASPDAYAAVFGDLAARRKDMEDRRGRLSLALTSRRPQAGADSPRRGAEGPGEDLALKALADAALVLSAPDVPEETKRDIVGMVVERVVCHRDGAEVHFLPGFGLSSFGRGTDDATDTLQSMNNVTTGRILWKQRLQAYETQDPPFNLSLSPDHQAVAVEEAFDSGNGYFLLVWRAGKGRQFLRHLRFSSSLYKHKPNLTNIRGDLLSPDCSILQISLSPDKSRLLIRVDWGMGDASIGVAELWCLGLNTGRLQVFGKWTEGDARWLTSRTISFVPASTGSMKPFREIVSVR